VAGTIASIPLDHSGIEHRKQVDSVLDKKVPSKENPTKVETSNTQIPFTLLIKSPTTPVSESVIHIQKESQVRVHRRGEGACG